MTSFIAFIAMSFSAIAQTSFTSVQDGNWDDASTWTLGGGAGGTEGIDYPSATDIVTIDHHVIIVSTNNGSNFTFSGELTINENDTLESRVGNNVNGFVLAGNGIMRNNGSFFTLDASETVDPNSHTPYEFRCIGQSIFIGGLNSFAFISDDWELEDSARVFLDNLLCYVVSDDVNFEGTDCSMYGTGNIRIGGDGGSSTVNFSGGATVAQLDDDITIWRNVSANDCSGTNLATGTNTAVIPPFALDDSYNTLTNTAQNQFVLTQGVDDFSPLDGDSVTLTSVGSNAGATNGNTSLGGTVSVNNNGTPSDPTDDYVVYTPPAATNGTDTYFYIITNEGGGVDTAEVTVVIAASIADNDGDGIIDSADDDDDNDGILDTDECGGANQKTVFTFTGSDQNYNVPAGSSTLSAKIWGAGGRGDETSGRGPGGAGGYTEFSIAVSSLTSTSLIVTVGEGGNSSTGSVTYGNGGAGLSGGGRNYGAGGGMSAITYTTLATPGSLTDADLVAIAGGGGTAAAFTNAGSQAGPGGGTTGVAGSDSQPTTGGGGTQVAGGTSSGGNAGSYLQGGNAVTDGGAGGGGYYGGGSGYVSSGNEGLGGGGSGYVPPAATSSTTTAGTNQTPPNTGDADYVAGVGTGGNSGGVNGGNGLVVIEVTVNSCDTDNDGIDNTFDLDSDNDGIPDIVEAGGTDSNGDGKVDNATDTDGDGWADTFDSDNGGTALTIPDTDGDGYVNTVDIDSDGDGIIDIIEAQASGTLTSPSGSDANNNGADDAFDPDNGNSFSIPVDSDGDDTPDYLDTDSDDDGVSDAIEAYDTDNDGAADTSPAGTDTDTDGLDDNYDNVVGPNATTNVTNNGQSSSSFPNDDNTATPERDWREIEDNDGDGVVDALDTDDDNDGILDENECGGPAVSTTFTFSGSDQNYTVPVAATEISAKLWGAGGRGDQQSGRGVGGAGGYTSISIAVSDLTSNSLIVTVGEGGNSTTGSVTYGNGGAGFSSVFNSALRNYGSGGGMSAISYMTLVTPGSVSVNDLIAIAGGGGSMPAFSNAGTNAGEGGGTTGGAATDANTAINGQGGTQSAGGGGNGTAGSFLLGGDAIENGSAGGGGYYGGSSGSIASSDEGGGGGGSGYINPLGSGTTTAGNVQTPPNTGDADYVAGVGEGGNNNGVAGGNGLVVITAIFSGCDSDNDGIPNSNDLDSDNDGIPDLVEAGGTDANGDGIVDDATDTDGDGWADTFDSDDGGTALTEADTDGDGFKNFFDVDSDSDGITDNVEAQTTLGFTAPSGTDTDEDGLDDSYDPDNGGTAITLSNNESAGNPDYTDTDSDGDGLFDWTEGFDDNNSGDALDDFISRATAFETAAGNPLYYVNSDDGDADGIPDWLEDTDADNVPNFLDPDNALYQDTDNDGLVDLFDTDNFGVASATPDGDGDGEYDFRDTDDEISLPIDLLSFELSKVGGNSLVQWVTASEVNNNYFTIERSADGKLYKSIGTVHGAGTSYERISYQLLDEEPLVGANYYRLRQTDFDGKYELFPPKLLVFEAGDLTRLTVYPNPNQGLMMFFNAINLEAGTYQLEILDMHAKLLYSELYEWTDNENSVKEIHWDNALPKGVYIIRLKGQSFQKELKMVVN